MKQDHYLFTMIKVLEHHIHFRHRRMQIAQLGWVSLSSPSSTLYLREIPLSAVIWILQSRVVPHWTLHSPYCSISIFDQDHVHTVFWDRWKSAFSSAYPHIVVGKNHFSTSNHQGAFLRWFCSRLYRRIGWPLELEDPWFEVGRAAWEERVASADLVAFGSIAKAGEVVGAVGIGVGIVGSAAIVVVVAEAVAFAGMDFVETVPDDRKIHRTCQKDPGCRFRRTASPWRDLAWIPFVVAFTAAFIVVAVRSIVVVLATSFAVASTIVAIATSILVKSTDFDPSIADFIRSHQICFSAIQWVLYSHLSHFDPENPHFLFPQNYWTNSSMILNRRIQGHPDGFGCRHHRAFGLRFLFFLCSEILGRCFRFRLDILFRWLILCYVSFTLEFLPSFFQNSPSAHSHTLNFSHPVDNWRNHRRWTLWSLDNGSRRQKTWILAIVVGNFPFFMFRKYC